ncbi:hypothetical protein DSO57_1024893 [Entomophthora muscae]|uniref:Uncharacterized protein n=1 Tax=Entomophthora muscae TaxID=34485 RepID=A0ACC2SF32_9FUNG|nr:hypothetical protein DSO57_1024893 [Entomophthora muscae]
MIPTSSNIQDSDLTIKALQHLKPNNLKLVPTQEQLVKFISNKHIAVNLPTPKALDVLTELRLTHELKQFLNGECFLLHNNGPGFKDWIICYSTQQNLMELKRASTWLVDNTFATCPWMFYLNTQTLLVLLEEGRA